MKQLEDEMDTHRVEKLVVHTANI